MLWVIKKCAALTTEYSDYDYVAIVTRENRGGMKCFRWDEGVDQYKYKSSYK